MDIVSYHCTDHRCEGKVISEGLGWRCCIWLLFGSFLRAGRRRSHSLSSCQRPEGVRCAAMGDGFWSRPPAPNYVSPGIIKRQLLESGTPGKLHMLKLAISRDLDRLSPYKGIFSGILIALRFLWRVSGR